jgi:hypothetical protein
VNFLLSLCFGAFRTLLEPGGSLNKQGTKEFIMKILAAFAIFSTSLFFSSAEAQILLKKSGGPSYADILYVVDSNNGKMHPVGKRDQASGYYAAASMKVEGCFLRKSQGPSYSDILYVIDPESGKISTVGKKDPASGYYLAASMKIEGCILRESGGPSYADILYVVNPKTGQMKPIGEKDPESGYYPASSLEIVSR